MSDTTEELTTALQALTSEEQQKASYGACLTTKLSNNATTLDISEAASRFLKERKEMFERMKNISIGRY